MREGHVEGQTGEVRPTGPRFLIYSMVDLTKTLQTHAIIAGTTNYVLICVGLAAEIK